MKPERILTLILLLTLVLLSAVACAAAPPETSGKLEVHDVWGRNSPAVAQNGAFYMTIVNNSAENDALLAARTDACATAELHEMYMKENDVMGMRPVEGGQIPVPAGETVALKTGGLHVMCLGKLADFALGDTYPITLVFAHAGEMAVMAEIRESAPADGMNMADAAHDNTTEEVTVPNNGAEVHITSPAPGSLFKSSDTIPVTIETQNFTIGEEGKHWHIYVDGDPIMVMGGNTFVLQSLSPGEHHIEVFLSLGTHENLEDGDAVTVMVEE